MAIKVKRSGTTLWRGQPIGSMTHEGEPPRDGVYVFTADKTRLGTLRLKSTSQSALRNLLLRKMLADERASKR